MPVFVDKSTGKRYEVPDDQAEAAHSQYGLTPIESIEHEQAVERAGDGTSLQALGQAFQRGIGARAEAIQNLTGFGTAPGLDEDDQGNKLPGGGLTSLQGAYSPEAKLVHEAHPVMAGIGTGASVAGETALGGMALGAVAPVAGLLGTSVGAVGGESAVQAVAQEYDDAWLEQRPMQLQNVAANTLAFAGADFLFRGALHGAMSVFGSKAAAKPASEFGGRNVVSEAQGVARETVEPVGGGSVGAASARDMAEPFDDAIKQMSDRDAAVLTRDADSHYHLIAQDASESFTRLNDGLSDNLGTQLKHQDIAKYAEDLDPKTVERQSKWWESASETADAAARKINALHEGDGAALDFGNLGKRASGLIDDFNRRISGESDFAKRTILTDEFKRSLDKLTMSIDASRSVDAVTRGELKSLIAPTRETLRKGLENSKYFGGAADLQKSLNAPWHGLLEHWSKVQNTLSEATGHVQFDVSGAGRMTRESTVDRMLSLLGKDPRANQEFGRHLAGSLENLQGLIEARQAHGIVRTDGLEAMSSDIRNMMEDWNLAQTIGVAKNRTASLAKDPRKWGALAANIGERLPIVGKPIQLARTLGDAFTDLHIQKGTPLGRVWDSAYKRYALNPAFQDPSIIRNYPDWIAESLTARGGKFQPPGGGAVGTPDVPSMAPANEVEQDVAGGALERAQARESQSGRVVIGERAPVAQKLSKDEIAAVDSFATDYRAAGMIEQGASDADIAAALPEYTPEAIGGLRERMPSLKKAWQKLSVWNPTSDKPLVKGMAMTDDQLAELTGKGEWTTPNSTYATWDPGVAKKFAGRGAGSGKRPVLLVYDGVPSAVPSVGGVKKYDTLTNAGRLGEEMIIPRGIPFKVKLGPVEDGVQTVLLQGPAMGEGGYVNFAGSRTGSNFSLGGLAASPMGVGTAAAAGLAINAAVQRHAASPPQSPEATYRDALKEIDKAGDMRVKAMASAALRMKPPRGKQKDPLALFSGKQSIQDAVEATRDRLDEISSDPTSLLSQLGSSSGAIAKTHPGVYMAMTQKAGQVAAYLQSVIPARTATTLLNPVGSAPSFDRAWDYAARFVGATQPMTALKAVTRGGAPPEMLEAVQQNWPELWDGFRVEMLGQVQRMHAAGRHIPSEKLRRLDSMLGLGGQLDPSASIEVTQHMLAAQDAEAAKRQQAGKPAGGMAPSGGAARSSLSTRLGSINQERQ